MENKHGDLQTYISVLHKKPRLIQRTTLRLPSTSGYNHLRMMPGPALAAYAPYRSHVL